MIRKAQEKGLGVAFLNGRQRLSRATKGKRQDSYILMGKILEDMDNPPDIIYDEGDIGIEAMIRLFARNPRELLKKMEMIAR